MFYRVVSYRWMLYSYSNLLIAKANQIPLRSVPRLFTIDSIDKLRYAISVFNKAINYSTKLKTNNEIIFAPVFSNWYTDFSRGNKESVIMPSAVFLFLKRPLHSNPYDLDLFRNDSKLWHRRLRQIEDSRRFIPIFVYDPLHMSDILVCYTPLILVHKSNEDGVHTTSCYADVDCRAYAEINDFYILTSLWIPNGETEYVEKLMHSKVGNLVRLCNPFFCSNPFKGNHSDTTTISSTQAAHQIISKNANKFSVVIEFSTSCIAVMDNIMQKYLYTWLSIPSIKLLHIIHKLFNNIKADKLLIIDILANFSEFGSLNRDRMWLKILSYITKAKHVKAVIGGNMYQ